MNTEEQRYVIHWNVSHHGIFGQDRFASQHNMTFE